MAANHTSEIYENLPCERSGRSRHNEMETNEAPNQTPPTAMVVPQTKESLYATPLRKSDRPSGGKTCTNSSSRDGEQRRKGHTGQSNKSSGGKKNGASGAGNEKSVGIPNQDPILEQRRMRNFLKDQAQPAIPVTPSHKGKGSGGDAPHTTFSALAQEEHFANLVQQNVLNHVDNRQEEQLEAEKDEGDTNPADETMTLEELEEKCLKNLEMLTQKAAAAVERELGGQEEGQLEEELLLPLDEVPPERMFIRREWALKKILICLEQRTNKRGGGTEHQGDQPQSNHLGALILGSNGSGKTTICQSILEGGNGSKGLLNRRLLCCYLISSQNPECHSVSNFIRSLVLQILSHSSHLFKGDEDHCLGNERRPLEDDEDEEKRDERKSEAGAVGVEAEGGKLSGLTTEKMKELEEMLISELQSAGHGSPLVDRKNKSIVRQQSEPVASGSEDVESEKRLFGSNPVLNKGQKETPKKISKIPVKIGTTPRGSPKVSVGPSDEGEEQPEKQEEESPPKAIQEEEDIQPKEAQSEPQPKVDDVDEESVSVAAPPPLPKVKDCRTLIADAYYELLLSNPEITESLSVDCIEKNPDECFKKVILFPLLELSPPKSSLLFLVDSIDEHYITESSLISTLKRNSSSSRKDPAPSVATGSKSQNVAELLSQHVHLLPKWLFLCLTGKRQNKHVTRLFGGFKKITIDDLRKSHVVKDVQEYIILRLNTDFRNALHLTKDVIDSLNQLYLKSNGCLLYLEKVLNGIREGLFTFREIRMLPCSLNGLYLYVCQKLFNKKQFVRVRPILNVLLAVPQAFVPKDFVLDCLRTQQQDLSLEEFESRLQLMRHVLVLDKERQALRLFHNSFADWLIDVKFSTKKFLCDVNEGHLMIAMYYAWTSDRLCPNMVRRFVYHLIKAGEFLQARNQPLDLVLFVLETRANIGDCLYTNSLSCCRSCELEAKTELNLNLPRTRQMLSNFIDKALRNEPLQEFLNDFFKPHLPTDPKSLKLLIETGINNADTQLSYDSSLLNSPVLSDKSQNIDSELADLLISSERSCHNTRRQQEKDGEVIRGAEAQAEEGTATGRTTTADLLSNDLSSFETNFMELHKGKALIHILANEGNHLLLERALRACKDPIDLEIEDVNGQTALNIACRTGHVEVVRLLLGYQQRDAAGRLRRVDVNHADRDGWTPLRSASWGGHTEVVKLLIAQPGCAIDLADKEGRSALRAAAWSGHEDILKILIEAGANVNSVDKQGRSSLIAASYMGQFDIVEILLESGADVNHLDLDGRSALCVAALCGSSGYSRVISTLLEHGAHTDQLDNDGMSPLLVSAFEGNVEICELLLENGADPDLADFMGRTPLWAACTSGFVHVVKLLLFWGCSIDCMDSEGRTVLSIAAAQGNLETVRQLLDRGLDEMHRDNAGWTPMHYAAYEGYPEVCTQLIESGAKIDECDNEGKTPLHLAAQEGHNPVVQTLLEVHPGIVDQRAHDGKTAFRLAAVESHFECVQTLLRFHCDPNSRDADSRTTLYILALENKVKIVKFLLEHAKGLDVNVTDLEGRTPLHVAAWQGHCEMVRMLIQLGHADVNANDLELRTPLHSCAWQGNHEVMEVLLCYGAQPDHACKQGATALGISAQEGHELCVGVLLRFGANPFKSDHCGRTPLKLALKSNRTNVLRILESYTKGEAAQAHIKSPERPEKGLAVVTQQGVLSGQLVVNGGGNFLAPSAGNSHATNSTQSSNFYENTMRSDHSNQTNKRKSVISSHSTGSSNEQAPVSFTQQLQRHTRHHGARSSVASSNGAPVVNGNSKYAAKKHSNPLPHVQEYQSNIVNEADLFDLGCMSPLYASPPHSPSSDVSSPGQEGAEAKGTSITDNHFTRDTHMRIILGNSNLSSGAGKGDNGGAQSKSKRSGIATNPAMRIIRDSAANLIRRTNNMLSSNNQGSSSIAVKSGTFQWRKESQM